MAIYSLFSLSLLLSFDVHAQTYLLDSLKELKESAEQGDAEAQFVLGGRYDFGMGVPENDRTAVRWYLKAAEQGLAEAQFSLGSMFCRGEGVPKDNVQAYAWISIANVQRNFEVWKNAKEIVANSMTRDEITRAQALSDNLWEAFGSDHSTK